MGVYKTTVIEATNYIFPGLADYNRKREFYNIGNQILSSFPLQVALVFNVWIYPAWLVVMIIDLYEKYEHLTDIYKSISVTVLVIIHMFEPIRLFLGYLGNLKEQIPALACFWLISTFIDFPLATYLLIDREPKPYLGEIIVTSIMLFLVIIEIITTTITLKKSANYNARRFYVAQLYGISDRNM